MRNNLDTKAICNMIFVIFVWWGIWSMLDLSSGYLARNKILTHSQTYLIITILGLILMNMYGFEL